MKKFTSPLRYCVFILFTITLSGCGMFDKLGAHLTGGVASKTDSVGRGLIKGIAEQLGDPATKRHITNLLDSIVISLDSTLRPRVKGMMNTVMSHKVILWTDSLVEAVTGKQLKLNVRALQYEMVGRSTADILKIRNSFKQMLDDMLSEDTDKKIGKLRDEILGPKTDTAISRIVDHATAKVVDQINNRLTPHLKEDASYFGKIGGYLLLAVGGIAVIIILVVWWNKRKYIKMVNLLTKHIHNIPDQKVYDKITSQIKDEAITTGIEPDLRKILSANGLIKTSDWKTKETT